MGYETPYPEPRTPHPRTPHGNCWMISRNNLSMKINKFAFKRSMISISKYPESFVKWIYGFEKNWQLLIRMGMKPTTASE